MKKSNRVLLILIVGLGIFFTNSQALAEDLASINLDIESATSTLFKGAVEVSVCAASASSTPTLSGYCAVKQSGLESDWSTFGDDLFLNSIAGVANDYANNQYWGWFSNFEYGQTSLNKHILTQGENLLVIIGKMPLKISVSTTTPVVGSTTTVSVFYFGFDSSWNGVWLPAATSTIKIGDVVYLTNEQGQYDLAISASTPFTVFAEKENFLNSNSIIIDPVEENISNPTPSNTEGGGSTVTSQKNFDTSKALQFLLSKQKSNGSIGSILYTDWATIALVAAGENSGKEKIGAYLKSTTDSLSSATDYERRAMALMALGINPYNGTSINFIQKIVDKFDGDQIGDNALVNDDIFAIFPLMKAGYLTNDPIIQKIVAFVISKQNPDGSWVGSVDLSAAAIQALNLVSSETGALQALANAKNFISIHQQSDGSFGSSFSTSWALQAVWSQKGLDSLANIQQSDGGVEPTSVSEDTRIWATAYAIPAALGKPWSAILFSFPKSVFVSANPVNQDVEAVQPKVASTTTVASHTPTFATILPLATISAPIKKTEKANVKNVEDNTPETSTSTVAPNIGSSQVAAVGESAGAPISKIILFSIPFLIGVSGVLYVYHLKNK